MIYEDDFNEIRRFNGGPILALDYTVTRYADIKKFRSRLAMLRLTGKIEYAKEYVFIPWLISFFVVKTRDPKLNLLKE